MPLVSFRELSLDATDPKLVGQFWADLLGQELEVKDDGDVQLTGPAFPSLWHAAVPEPKTVKNRVHVDVHAPVLGPILDLGATVLADHGRWTVVADPEGNELCVFPGEGGARSPAAAFAICVDSPNPVRIAAWWHKRLGGELGPGPDGQPRWLHHARGLGRLVLKFVPTDDPRVVKNRCHWDVTATRDPRDRAERAGDGPLDDATVVAALQKAGARLLRPRDDEIRWSVMADPDGNEFCAFAA